MAQELDQSAKLSHEGLQRVLVALTNKYGPFELTNQEMAMADSRGFVVDKDDATRSVKIMYYNADHKEPPT